MQSNALTTLKNTPGFAVLAGAVLLLGFATSFAMPYMSLFGVNAVRMSPVALGAYLTGVSLGSILISTVIGRWSDRLPSRRPLLLGAIAAATLGYGLLAVTTDYVLVLLIGTLLLGAGSAAFPQVFALARTQAGAAGEQGMTTIRSIFSLAWVVGPGIGAALLATGGFSGLFLATGACFLASAAAVMLLPARPTVTTASKTSAEAPPVPAPPDRPMSLVALSFVLYGTAIQMASVALPIHVTENLNGTSGSVGFIVGLCALLEIPVMLSFVLSNRRPSNEKLVLWGLVLSAVYCAIVLIAPNVWWIAAAQLPRAVVIAILATLGMAYVQSLMPGRLGVATTLYANTMNAGSLLGGLGVGVCAHIFGYQAVFLVAALLSAAAWGVLLATRRGLGTRPIAWRRLSWRGRDA